MNVFLQRDSRRRGACARSPTRSSDFDKLGLPAVGEAVRRPAARPRARDRPDRLGQVARRSPRSSTSSTAPSRCHIMTVEDPIEFLHNAQARGRQPARGGGGHALVRRGAASTSCARTPTSSSSARCATSRRSRPRSPRRRPATSCSRTLHTQDAPQSIDRIIDVFPAAPAAADPRAARRVAAGHLHPAAAADRRRQRPGGRAPRCSSPRPRSATSSVRARPTRSTR